MRVALLKSYVKDTANKQRTMPTNCDLAKLFPLFKELRQIQVCAFILVASLWSAWVHALPPNFQEELVVAGNLDNTTYLVQLPDGRMLAAEKTGDIKIFDPSDPTPITASDYLTIPDVEFGDERGVATMAVDPNFAQNPYIYVYYTHGSSNRNRISRFTHTGDEASAASELMIWQASQDWTDCCHYGGGMGFGPDGRLYLATGEEFDGAQSQDLTRSGGKVIRINSDGSIPADNPFHDGAGPNLDEIWARGLRNPYRAYWDLVTERFYIGEVGSNNSNTAREDIHVATAGANFGWPACEGQCLDPQFSDPVFDYPHIPGRGGAVTMGTVYRGNLYPSEYVGDLFYADFAGRIIRFLNLNPDGSVASDEDFGTFPGVRNIVHLMQGADGRLYYADLRGNAYRINFTATNQPPVINSTNVNTAPGEAPAQVTFSVNANDPEDDALQYHWFFGDGNDAFGATVSHTYQSNGPYNAFVQVSDAENTTSSDIFVVQVGNLPGVTISQPSPNQLFRAGDVITYAASATDPDETLQASNFSWNVELAHNTHTHPAITNNPGLGGTFQINTTGHEYLGDTGYNFTVTVTDSDNISTTETVTVLPDKVDITFATTPISTEIFVDGVPVTNQTVYDTLIDFQHVVSVPDSVCSSGINYDFVSWSDGGTQTHAYTVPTTDETLTANFVENGACESIPGSGLVLYLEADAGVSTTGVGQVTEWFDQSPRQNHLTAAGAPTLIPGSLNGLPTISFDGNDDKLERVTALMGMAEGNEDRSVVLLARYNSNGFGGLVYGVPECTRAFGTVVDNVGNLAVQGWCNDLQSSTEGNGAGWLVQSAVFTGGEVAHYKDNVLIDSAARAFDTVAGVLVLGAEIDGTPFVGMEVAAALIYDRALTGAERGEIQNYLQSKYFGTTGNQPPVATGDTDTVLVGQSAVTNVLGNDSDVDGTLNPSSVVVVSQPINGSTQVNTATGEITYIHNGVGTTDSYQYRVSDDLGAQSNSATVIINVSNGNLPPVVVDDIASVQPFGSVLTNVLANDTDDVGIDRTTVSIVNQPSKGTVSVNPVSGVITYTHIGPALGQDSYQYEVQDDFGLISGNATVTISIGEGARVTDGLLSLYTFDEQSGVTITDTSGVGDPLDLVIQDPQDVTWGDGTLTLDQGASIFSPGAASKINDAVKVSNEITIEALIVPSNLTQSGPARVVSISASTGARNVTLGQEASAYNTRLRTTSTNHNGTASAHSTPDNTVGTVEQHVVYTRHSDGTSTFYVNGVMISTSTIGGSTSSWSDNYKLLLGSEVGDSRHWLGTFDLVAIYDRALGAAEVTQNFVAGTGVLNQSPIALDDTGAVAEGDSVALDVLGNDSDSDGTINAATVFVEVPPNHGSTAVDSATGEVTYTHDGSQNLTDSFQYQVSDNLGLVSNLATVDLEVSVLIGSPPVAVNDFANVLTAGSVVIPVLANDSDADGPLDLTSVEIEVEPDNGDVSVDPQTGEITYTHIGGLTTGDSFRYSVRDLDGRSSNIAVVSLSIGTNFVPQAGLVLRLESDSGVVLDGGGGVTGWNDLSGNGNHFLSAGDPVLVSNVLNGLPAIDLDGNGDVLERLDVLSAFPGGNADRTIVALANYRGPGFGGISYGAADCEQAFGAVVSPSGNLTLQGWCTDFETAENAVGAGWLSHTIIVSGEGAQQYLGSTLIGTHNVADFDTALTQMHIGAEIDGTPNVDMQVGAVLVYDRALTAVEFAEVQTYLQQKYLGSAGNLPPTALDDADSVGAGGIVITAVLGNDVDPENSIDVSSVVITTEPSFGEVSVDAGTGEVSYTNNAEAASDSYQYQFFDAPGAISNVATVTITVDANQAPVAEDDFAFVVAGSSVVIPVLANDSDPDGTVDETTVALVQSAGLGSVVVDPLTGEITYSPIAGANSQDTFTYEVRDHAGLVSNEAVVQLRVGSTALPETGLVMWLESDNGLTLGNQNAVQTWTDGSGQGNTLTAGAGQPTLEVGALNGLNVVTFDGVDDVLERLAGVNLPSGNADRTVLMVANYVANTGYGGFAYGLDECDRTFGTIVHANSNLTVQGWCTDFDSGLLGTGQGWLLQSARMEGGQLTHYMNDDLIGTHSATSYDTALARIRLGTELDGDPALSMQVAAVLVYDGDLTVTEFNAARTYLQEKYFAANSEQTPVAVDDFDIVNSSQSVVTDVLENDFDLNSGIDVTSVAIVGVAPTRGSLSVNPTTGEITYTHNGTPGGADSYQYRVFNLSGLPSNIATVAITINGAGNSSPVANDDQVTTSVGGTVEINVLSNDVDDDGAIDPTTVTVTSIPVNGSYSVDPNTGLITYVHNGTATNADSLRYEVMDNLGESSNEATVDIDIGNSDVPTAGLVLRLESDQGTILGNNSTVTQWLDQSDSQNHLSSAGDPILQSNGLNGLPIISFDGVDDSLERIGGLTGLPSGNADRTVVLVASYQEAGFGGFAWGDDACSRTFGNIVGPNGNLAVQSWCVDYLTTTAGTGAGFLTHSSLLGSGQLDQYLGTALIDSQAGTNFDTALSRIVLGAEIDGNPAIGMQVAAVFVWDRAVSTLEFAQIQEYIEEKYFSGSNIPPAALDDSDSVAFDGNVATEVLANDSDPEGQLDAASISVVVQPTHGTATVDTLTSEIIYTHNGVSTVPNDTYQYQVFDAQGAASNLATVTVSISGLPNVPPMAVDDSVQLVRGGSITIDVLSNDSDQDGTIDPTTVSVVDDPANGTYSVNPTTGQITYNHDDGASGSDLLRYEFMDDDAATSNIAAVNISISDSTFPEQGLVLHLEADQGVLTAGTEVTDWFDSSASGNSLTAVGGPELLESALNGRPVIDFDGVTDRLQRLSAVNDLPIGSADRTAVMVVNYRGTGFGGFAYGTDTCQQTFGLVTAPTGDLALQGWCTDFVSSEPGTAAGWLVQSVVVSSEVATHYRANNVIGTHSVDNFNTSLNRIVVGAEIDSSPAIDMQVAAIMAYDRALTSAEFDQLQAYLQEKYFAVGGNQAPSAQDDTDQAIIGGQAVTDVLSNDSDPDGSLDAASVVVEVDPSFGDAQANPVNGEITYVHTGPSSVVDTYQYRVSDALGLVSNLATVTITVGEPNQPPVAADDTDTVVQGLSVVTAVLGNDSDPDGSIDPTTVDVTRLPLNGLTQIDATTGDVTYTHNGGLDTTDSYEYEFQDNDGDVSNTAEVTLSILLPRVSNGLLALYRFDEGTGTSVNDSSGSGAPLDLSIANPGRVTWNSGSSGSLTIDQPTLLSSAGAARKLNDGIEATEAVTVEAWISTADLNQNGPARIVSLSRGTGQRNLTLGQGSADGGDQIDVRLRTLVTGTNGLNPSLSSGAGTLATDLSHVVYVRDSSGLATLYIDNVVLASDLIDGGLHNWHQNFALSVANESTQDRPWLGTIDLIAIYDRALGSEEVSQNYQAGPQ